VQKKENTMTRKAQSILGTFALATLLMGAVAAHANDLRNFWFDNETGKTVAVLMISPHESGTWYPVPNSTTRSGYRNPITFNSNFYSSCFFDFKLEYADGNYQTYTQGRNLCNISGVRFYSNESTPII
jgi:hypothetical protein